ncbi:MAG: type III secretion system needle filament subunit SctF [Alteromonadaceae bacterium]|nr:type III secretion system needle filament subunit SctF [Alteromonadaceae bacterium]
MAAYTPLDVTKGFSINSASQQLSAAATTVNDDMNKQAASLAESPDDPSALANFNAATAKWSVVMNVISTINKTVKDASMSIVQKM